MNASPPARVPHAALTGGRLDIARTLTPVRVAIGLTRIARGVVLGFALGALLVAGALVAAHTGALSVPLPVALFAVAACALGGAGWGLARWPRPLEAARRADLYFGLDDRLTTALELRSSTAPVAQVQSRDAARHIEGLPLRRSRGRWLGRSEAAVVAVAMLALSGSLALGPHHTTHHVSAATTTTNSSQARRTAARQIQRLRAQLRLGLTPGAQSTQTLRKLDQALARLRRQLLRAPTTRASLRAISLTQQQLHQLASQLHPINARAVAQLNGSLSHYLGKQANAAKTGTSAHRAQATAQALNHLAQSLAHLSPSQRAALARALAVAANATQNNTLRSPLRQAASALAAGNPRGAGGALQRAAQALSRSAGAQTSQSLANATAAQLGALKSALTSRSSGLSSSQGAGLSGNPNTRSGVPATRSRPGKAQGRGLAPGRGRGRGNGRGSLLGQGQSNGTRRGAAAGRGSGRGQGRGVADRRGVRATRGRGVSGSRGNGGVGQSRLTRPGHSVTVYIPGKQGKGQDIVRNGPNWAPEPGAIVPYQQVLQQYAQGAHAALDRGALPPSVQEYVRRYFSTISH